MESKLLLQVPEETQSPYLPGTQTQFAWDSTSLELLKRCPRLYQLSQIEGWQPKGEAIHLRFGIEVHQAFHDYELFKVDGLDHDSALRETVRKLLIRTKTWEPDAKTASEEKKSKQALVQTVVWYLDKWKDDPAKTIILDNGKPALEVSFRFDLDFGPKVGTYSDGPEGHETPEGQPYLLCGHLDRIVDYQGSLFVMDRKTTTYSLTPYWFNQWSPHNQMSLYSIAGKVVLDTPIRGVIIDGIKIGDEPEFQRGITYRTQDQMDEWLADLQFWFALAEDYATEGYWPMNDTACDKYGGCKFREICAKSPAARPMFLKSMFNQLPPEDRWNPLAVR